ncbi:MAG: hypothetical protein RLZZ546_2834 [Bacteroidota bacterium]|jgi:MtN3 and saliva related transmembrane protein
MSPDILGYVAATLTTVSFIPQFYKIYKSKSAKDVSITMFTIFTIGLTLWLYYGVLLKSLPIIISNTVTVLLSLGILFMKIKYDKSEVQKNIKHF